MLCKCRCVNKTSNLTFGRNVIIGRWLTIGKNASSAKYDNTTIRSVWRYKWIGDLYVCRCGSFCVWMWMIRFQGRPEHTNTALMCHKRYTSILRIEKLSKTNLFKMTKWQNNFSNTLLSPLLLTWECEKCHVRIQLTRTEENPFFVWGILHPLFLFFLEK